MGGETHRGVPTKLGDAARRVGGWAAIGLLATSSAFASDMTFEFNNPSFGGNPFNSNHLNTIASAQNDFDDPDAIDRSDPSAQFVRTLQSRLLSALASQITDAIFGENAQDQGLIKFGDQEVSFVRGLDSVNLTITNFIDGSVTEIVIPLLDDGTGDDSGDDG